MMGMLSVALIDEVGVLGLVLLLVGSDGPLAEVVDLLIDIVGDFAVRSRCGPGA